MSRLRGPGGCPWDAEQTHESLSIHLIEEAYETVDAIDSGDLDALRDELGDLLLQVVFHSEIEASADGFDVADVIDGLIVKLVERHPHIFGETKVSGSAEVLANWEAIKKAQRPPGSIGDDIPQNLPSLLFTHKVLRRMSGAGRAYEANRAKLGELAGRLSATPNEEALGELLFEIAAVAFDAGLDPEGALRRAAKNRIA